jgi:cobalt/nickel transport system permease protein
MSHIHIPDGIIPLYIWIPAYLITFGIIFLISKSINKDHVKKLLPLTGVMAALMLIGMSVPLVIIPVHLSLAVLTGILIGPKLGFIVVFVVSLILATFGHGGFTIVGINSLVIGSEVFIGSMLFKLLGRKRKLIGVVISTVIALIVSIALMFSVVGYAAGFSYAIPHTHVEDEHHEEHLEDEHHEHDHEHLSEAISEVNYLFFTGWIALILIFGFGVALETIVTALIVMFFYKVRPTLVDSKYSPADS